MYTSSVIARAKVALQGSETEQRIAVLLYDDTVQVISSFELNQLASLSYHESMILTSSRNDMVEILIDHVEQITSQPINYSIISVQKSLVVTKHLLLHGAQKVIPIIQQQLGRHIDTLRQYNTVLAAAQQQTTTAWLMRIKGGGVDTAGPVRELAEQVYIMLCNPQQLQFERNTNADPNSLVPIGDRQQIAFVTDDVRHAQLKLRMQQEQSIQMKSNLKKANDGFGGGYMSTNGKNVVGAAHGIEEMIKQKQKEEQRFSDESKNRKTSSSTDHSFSEYVAPTDFYSTSAAPTISSDYQQQQQQPDLLSLDHYETMPQQQQQAVVVDLLDLGSGVSATSATSTSNNYNSHHNDPFNLSMTAESTSGSQLYPSNLIPQQGSSATGGCTSSNPLLHPMSSTATLSLDPYANVASTSMSSAPPPAQQSTAMPFMNHSVDRFAALDVLAGGNNNVGSSMARNNHKSHTTTSNAFSDLVGPFASTSAPVSAATSYNNSNIDNLTSANNYYGFATAPPSMPTVALSSIQVSQPPPSYGNTTDGSENNDDSGFFMGGSTGAGLMPTGHAPASAPPPPPPASFY